MDVQCESCKTEYEFDDALVSGRGTTVRCTSCGHRFKVRRPEGDPSTDRWVVTTADGREITFVTLRELQRAILGKQVTRGDTLGEVGAPSRLLGSIAELEPFFEGRSSSRPPPPHATSESGTHTAPLTLPKPAPAWEASDPPPLPAGGSYRAPVMRNKMETLRPPDASSAMPPPSSSAGVAPAPTQPYAFVPPAPDSEEAVSTWRTFSTSAPPPPPPPAQAAPGLASLPPPTQPQRRAMPSDDDIPDMRASFPSAIGEPYAIPRRRRVGGWIVALALVLAVAVVAWAVAKQSLVARDAGATAHIDPRAQSFLADGEKALTEGDLELAQGSFDRASALAEKDPRVLLDEARVASAKADLPWLRLRLLPAEASDDLRATKAQLDERVQSARRAADDALSAAPSDPSAVRAKIDALRLGGDATSARGYVGKIIAQASQPETSFALAALDLAEPEPLWATVIARLRTASAGEGSAGRARAALVYALAMSRDASGARAELERLDAQARRYPLLPDLHAFVDRTVPRSAAAVANAARTASQRGEAAPAQAAVAVAPPSAVSAGSARPGASQATNTAAGRTEAATPGGRGGMQAAAQAIRKRDFERARQIYEGILAKEPNDSEAVAGLGDTARLQGDTAGATAAYKRAIAINPSYLPALLGLADMKWSSGDRAGAVRAYSDLVDRFPEGTYPAYVKQRAEGSPPPSGAAAHEHEQAPPSKPAPSSDQDGL